MARLGHSSARAAMIYQHATEDRDRLIAERLAAMTVEAGLTSARPTTAEDDLARNGTAVPLWHGCGTNDHLIAPAPLAYSR